MAFLAIYGYSLVSILQSLSVVVGGKYEEGPRIIWAVKGGVLSNRLATLVKLTPLHFVLNAPFWGTGREDF